MYVFSRLRDFIVLFTSRKIEQGCQIFLGNYTKTVKNISNGHKTYQLAIKVCQYFPFQGPPKFTQIEIFGKKI
jgi:hypothetical protein